MLFSSFLMLLALILDQLWGEPRRFHPLVGFGKMASYLEKKLNPSPSAEKQKLEPKFFCYWQTILTPRLRGVFAAAVLLLLPALLLQSMYINLHDNLQPLAALIIVYFCIARRSLFEHARAVASAGERSLAEAKLAVAKIVSRDTATMSAADVNRAVIESTLENGSDSIFAPLFWFLLAGVPGVVLYRCANTLDAMWGYRNPRFEKFGWAAAKTDDLLNYIPARLTALAYCLMADFQTGWRSWRQQARHCVSPNAGPVMCAGAGALGLGLGGAAYYHGQLQNRKQMGQGPPPQWADIERCTQLLDRSLLLLLGLASGVGLLLC